MFNDNTLFMIPHVNTKTAANFWAFFSIIVPSAARLGKIVLYPPKVLNLYRHKRYGETCLLSDTGGLGKERPHVFDTNRPI